MNWSHPQSNLPEHQARYLLDCMARDFRLEAFNSGCRWPVTWSVTAEYRLTRMAQRVQLYLDALAETGFDS